MFLLSGLANGLVQLNRPAVDSCNADVVLLSKNANATLALSYLALEVKDMIKADQVEP